MRTPFKIPQSVLVVIYTRALEVLLLRRADTPDVAFWQSVTGSKNHARESYARTAAREVHEETGLDCTRGGTLQDWRLQNVYSIYPRWLHRYASGVVQNTERVFGLQLPRAVAVTLNPREHSAYRWLAYREAAQCCFSASNAEAILLLPRFLDAAHCLSATRQEGAP